MTKRDFQAQEYVAEQTAREYLASKLAEEDEAARENVVFVDCEAESKKSQREFTFAEIEIVADLRERVARLEAAVMPKSVSGSIAESMENNGDTVAADGLRTEGWLTAEEREAVNGCLRSVREEIDLLKRWRPDHRFVDDWRRKEAVLTALLARETPPRVKVPPGIISALPHEREQQWITAIRAAGVEVE